MIVDDEKQIVDGLRKIINWSDLGYSVCATARNGKEAIEAIREHRPNLVLTDIRMPEMDGLSLLKYTRENISSDIEFIILSGYSEFEYARQALRYNVNNYILKPIDETILYKSLLEIKELLDEMTLRQSEKLKSYINNIMIGDKPDNELSLENEEQYGLRYIHIIRRRDYRLDLESPAGEKIKLPSLREALSHIIGEDNMRFVARNDSDNYSIVVGLSILSRFDFHIECLTGRICEYLRIEKDTEVDILVGKKVDSFCDIHESIKSIGKCMNKRFYTNGPSIIFFDNIKDETFSNVFEDKGAIINVITAFRKGDMDKLVNNIRQLVDHFASAQPVPELALIHLDSIMASVIQILNERITGICELADLYTAYKKIQDKLSIYELGDQAIDFCLHCNDFASKQSRHKSETINKIIAFVDNHFTEPIKITDIAEHFYINPAYLGQQFIKKKGCSLNHYLNSLRIEKSKELLKNTSLRIYEIASRVGFEDPNYFSAKFYDYTKMTPSDFRKS